MPTKPKDVLVELDEAEEAIKPPKPHKLTKAERKALEAKKLQDMGGVEEPEPKEPEAVEPEPVVTVEEVAASTPLEVPVVEGNLLEVAAEVLDNLEAERVVAHVEPPAPPKEEEPPQKPALDLEKKSLKEATVDDLFDLVGGTATVKIQETGVMADVKALDDELWSHDQLMAEMETLRQIRANRSLVFGRLNKEHPDLVALYKQEAELVRKLGAERFFNGIRISQTPKNSPLHGQLAVIQSKIKDIKAAMDAAYTAYEQEFAQYCVKIGAQALFDEEYLLKKALAEAEATAKAEAKRQADEAKKAGEETPAVAS